jgi:hypothetical protein
MTVGPTNAAVEDDEDDEELEGSCRTVKAGQRVSPFPLTVSGAKFDRLWNSLFLQRKRLRHFEP